METRSLCRDPDGIPNEGSGVRNKRRCQHEEKRPTRKKLNKSHQHEHASYLESILSFRANASLLCLSFSFSQLSFLFRTAKTALHRLGLFNFFGLPAPWCMTLHEGREETCLTVGVQFV